MKMIGYIRVSTDDQAKEGKSLSIQGLQINHYCELHGHSLDFVFIDFGVSASIELQKRPAGQAMMAAIKDKDIDGIVFQRFDRMFRIAADGLITGGRLIKCGIAVQSINEGVNINTTAGWLVFTMMLGTAEYERNKIIDRAREVTAGLKKQNKVWGHVPYGCIEYSGKVYRCQATWPMREWIQEMRDKQKFTFNAITKILFKNKIEAPKGGYEWHASTIMGLCNSFHAHKVIPMLDSYNETVVSNNLQHFYTIK